MPIRFRHTKQNYRRHADHKPFNHPKPPVLRLRWLLLGGALITTAVTATVNNRENTTPSDLFSDRKSLRQAIELELPAAATQGDATFSTLPDEIGMDFRATDDTKIEEVVIANGDSMAKIFARLELPYTELSTVLKSKPAKDRLRNIQPGQKMTFTLTADNELLSIMLEESPISQFVIERNAEGYDTHVVEKNAEHRTRHAHGTIDSSLFAAGSTAGLSDTLIMKLANIFGWDIDFALDIRAGDSFSVIYEEIYQGDNKIMDGDIIAAEFVNAGKTFRAIRYSKPDGDTDYYTPDGHSVRKAFLRTPVNFTRISSKFDPHRFHPILHTIRAHKGVDYAAPTGTPIKAAGDGKVIFQGWKGGYGRVVIIQHGQKYSTVYAHMSGFNKKVRNGSRVRQGQVIGYVGASGRASGPHLHYEFQVNGVHRNPLTVKLPDAQPLAQNLMTDFERQAKPLLSQLDVISRTYLALNAQQ